MLSYRISQHVHIVWKTLCEGVQEHFLLFPLPTAKQSKKFQLVLNVCFYVYAVLTLARLNLMENPHEG